MSVRLCPKHGAYAGIVYCPWCGIAGEFVEYEVAAEEGQLGEPNQHVLELVDTAVECDNSNSKLKD
jgi:uncharacterized Zn finger protein (UPF0148 family)